MTEPKAIARTLSEIIPGLFHFQIEDERIGGTRSDAFALLQGGESTLVDPVPLDAPALKCLGSITAVVIASPSHQRAAWRYRRQAKAKVHAPEGAAGLDETPDGAFKDGDRLPGGLRAVHAPGPSDGHYALHLERGGGVLFLTDLVHDTARGLEFLPDKYMSDPPRARRSLKRLLELKFEVVCCGHGAPLKKDARRILEDLLKRSGG
jgi:glyoxylase-like metal-dependent hydrolase (beta-lactamase superfamily II)